jgi:hypothetical protein
MGRQPVGPLIELDIRQEAGAETDGESIGRFPDAGLEKLMDTETVFVRSHSSDLGLPVPETVR